MSLMDIISRKLSPDIVCTVWSHTFTLLWSKKRSVIFETFQLGFHVFMCAFHQDSSFFFLY